MKRRRADDSTRNAKLATKKYEYVTEFCVWVCVSVVVAADVVSLLFGTDASAAPSAASAPDVIAHTIKWKTITVDKVMIANTWCSCRDEIMFDYYFQQDASFSRTKASNKYGFQWWSCGISEASHNIVDNHAGDDFTSIFPFIFLFLFYSILCIDGVFEGVIVELTLSCRR